MVGAPGEDSQATGVNGNQAQNTGYLKSGAAYVFVRSGTTWSQQAYLKSSNTGMEDGSATGLQSPEIPSSPARVRGQRGDRGERDQGDNSAKKSGAAYVFPRKGGLGASRPT